MTIAGIITAWMTGRVSIAASELSRRWESQFWWIIGVITFLLAVITVTMIVFVIRYHRTRHPVAVQIHGHLPIEIGWSVLFTVLALYIFAVGYDSFGEMRTPPADAMTIEVTARMWSWSFHYPEAGVTAGELVIPVNTPVRFNLTSADRDVNHSFYLPDFRLKEDCMPGRQTQAWVEADTEGVHTVFCAEYCGEGHAKMYARMRVVSREAYAAWLVEEAAALNKPIEIETALDPNSPAIVERDGEALYKTYCASCHGAGGIGGGSIQARNFTSLEGWKRGPGLPDIFRTLEYGLEGTPMRGYAHLGRWDRFALAHKVASFHPERPRASSEEIEALVREFRLGEEDSGAVSAMTIEEAMRLIVEEGRRDQ